jgi:hypothetical protein
MSTIGNADDFRYFWPRIAELLVTTQPDEYFVDPEIVLGKLANGEWRTWPDAEQRATEQYLVSLITRMSDEALYWSDVDGWVCGVGVALEDITPVLERALLADTPAGRANLFGLYHWNKRDIEKRRRLRNRFWDRRWIRQHESGAHPNVARIVAWFDRPDVSAAVDRAYAEAAVDGRWF